MHANIVNPNISKERGSAEGKQNVHCLTQFASKVELQINAFNVEFDVKCFWHLIVHCVMRCLQFSEVLHK